MSGVSARERVADFWDDVLADWRPGEAHLTGDLCRWHDSYVGRGDGAVDLAHYPDPYIGDLRGIRAEPRLVFLGLNPGVGYDSLQGDDGIWTNRVRDVGYSRCFERSPAEDPATWIGLHGKQSVYWRNVITFARRWVDDSSVGVEDLLNLELYPWHSKRIVGTLRPPVDLVQKYVWDPVQEVPVDEVFAFGRAWFDVCRGMELPEIAEWGPDTTPVPGYDMPHWRVSFFRLPSDKLVVVSSQSGSASPPGPDRTVTLKRLVADHSNS
jgi:hypothetical protein